MKKTLLAVLALSSVGLAGCIAVPAYDYGPRAYGPPAYGPPPAVIVQPSLSFGYSGYYGRPYHRHWR